MILISNGQEVKIQRWEDCMKESGAQVTSSLEYHYASEAIIAFEKRLFKLPVKKQAFPHTVCLETVIYESKICLKVKREGILQEKKNMQKNKDNKLLGNYRSQQHMWLSKY